MSIDCSEILLAAREGNREALVAALGPGSDFTKLLQAIDDYSGSTALHLAAANGHTDLIKLIFDNLSSDQATELVRLANASGNTALHWACLTGSKESAALLIDAGADILAKNKSKVDSIMQAENCDNTDLMDYLLDRLGVQAPLADREIADMDEAGSSDAAAN